MQTGLAPAISQQATNINHRTKRDAGDWLYEFSIQTSGATSGDFQLSWLTPCVNQQQM